MRYVDGKPHGHRHRRAVYPAHRRTSATEDAASKPRIERSSSRCCRRNWLKGDTKYLINPTGRFVIGGPQGDCGLTGRKIIVDTYGGACPARRWCLLRQGSVQGRPLRRLRRRYVAKNIVAAGLASRCQVQVSYAIGVASRPRSYGRHLWHRQGSSNEDLPSWCASTSTCVRRASSNMLDLLRPIYQQDRRLRPLRPRGARIHLGSDRSRGSAAQRRGAVSHTFFRIKHGGF